ncbi:hypothetical protein [Flavobacterium sp. XS1P27]|uniref:hypothetical protein n=1 Tax=Flavobacterium sp. XS1P27 TaxID=3401724 RepID=UPI003AAFF8A1
MIDKYITAFNEVKCPRILNSQDLNVWQGKAINIIVRVYGENSIQEEQIKNVLFQRYASYSINGHTSGGANNAKLCEKQATEIIEGFISDLSTFGMPSQRVAEKNGAINISINQNQNQTINLNVILDSLKEELTGKQIKELEEVINTDEMPENKKSKIINKLKSFGSDVVTNIVANILTNPSIFGG